ncbi:hypothetical protein F5Y16DRAFT_279200 [Xylariaceae sp. FL0255]|nr:hypothetical protein F5Y16DRAFT_279200 [Xylariaceae sp. FL0255]
MASFGVAIIGSGLFVKEEQLPAAVSCPLIDVKAIWSRSARSAGEAAKLIPHQSAPVEVYACDAGPDKSFDDLLARADITGMIITLPIVDQPSYIEKALAAGKHVLAVKPIAKDVATAVKLISYYKEVSAETKATLAIAENFRYQPGWGYGAEEIRKLGNVTGFVVRLNSMMSTSNKYYKTPWRATPEYQGGFLFDGGVHFTCALRQLLGPQHAVESVIAQTSLISKHLVPKDTVNAILRTKSGAVGSYIHSVGTTMNAFEFHIACEQGFIKAERDRVITIRGVGENATTTEKVFERTSGVKEEMDDWAKAVVSGEPHARHTPEMALGDLELVEKMLTSGDQSGTMQILEHQ